MFTVLTSDMLISIVSPIDKHCIPYGAGRHGLLIGFLAYQI